MSEIDLSRVEIQILGKVLEGHGAIGSELAETDWSAFGEALKQSVDRIQETEYSSCIDGRQTVELANGSPERLRPRKAGGGLAPFAMRGIGSGEFRQELAGVNTRQELFDKIALVNKMIGRRESAHAGLMPDGAVVFDCGAAGGFVAQTKGLGTLTAENPNAKIVFQLLAPEISRSVEPIPLLSSVSQGAIEFGNILQEKGWDGQAYVEQLMAKDPEAVELLQAKPDEVHGHAEAAVVLVDEEIGEAEEPTVGINKSTLKKLTGHEAFVVNVNEFRRASRLMTSTRDEQIRFIISNLLYHTQGVYNSLGDGSHPLFYLKLHR